MLLPCFSLIGTLQIGYLDTGNKKDDDDKKPPIYLAQPERKDEFAVPAPVLAKVRVKKIGNVLPRKESEGIEEHYKEPWEEEDEEEES